MTRHPQSYRDQKHIEVIVHRRVKELTRKTTGDKTKITYA